MLGYRDARQSTQRAYEKWVAAQKGQGLNRLLQGVMEKVGGKQPPRTSWESFMMDGLYKQRNLD